MQLPLYLPNVKTKSTKDLILRLLTEHEVMTNQQLFLAIKKQFAVSITYQAVRQALVELTTANVLEKSRREYSLSKKWIETLHNYSSVLKEKYIDQKKIQVIDECTTEIRLQSLNEMGNFIMESFHERFFDLKKKNDLFMYVHHLWFPFFSRKKRKKLDDFFNMNKKNYVFVKNKSFVDRVFSIYYKKFGKVYLGKSIDKFFDIIIQGDCIVKIYMPKELRNRMDKMYRSKVPFGFKNLDEFADFTFHPYPIKIVITRDEEMAKEMKELLRHNL